MQKLSDNKKQLIEFLIQNSGKPDELTWIELATLYKIKDALGNTSGENARQLWKNYRKNMIEEEKVDLNKYSGEKGASQYKELIEQLQSENMKVKSLWTSGDKINISVAPDTHKEKEDYSSLLKEELLKHIKENKSSFKKKSTPYAGNKVGVAITADYHIGAYIEGLVKTQDFSIGQVIEYLDQVAEDINSFRYSEVHLIILGDLIESFTGLNHINSWKGLESGAYGGNVVIMAYEILKNFFSKITNLSNVYMISGNHDRVTSNNQEDVDGDVAKILAYFLAQNCKGVNIDFHPMVITKVIDNICYIMTHGHLGFSNKDLGKVLFQYGKQGYYNVLLSGHLHTRRSTQNIISTQTIMDDCADYRSIICPSLFTGNFYSESNGWTSTAGYLIIENRFNKPLVVDIPLS
jgi:predicted phosphodiesterase